jgi:beta-glucosidase-like glycosyl hydrolase
MTPAIFGLAGLTLSAVERAFFREADPAGYIIFGRNVESREQVRALTDDLRGIHGRDKLLISIDQEGGRVARMKPPVWPAYPSGEALARLYQIAPASAIEAARANAEALGHDLAEAGITVDHAPTLDVRQPGADDVIGDRALGTEPLQVAALGRAWLDGLAVAGVAGTIKHLPGHGRTMCDTHKALPTVTASDDELAVDLAPFIALREAPIGMTGHLLFTAGHPVAVRDRADHPPADRFRRAAADRRSRHGSAVRLGSRTRRTFAQGGLRHRAQLLGENGRHDGYRQSLRHHETRNRGPARPRARRHPARRATRCPGAAAGQAR